MRITWKNCFNTEKQAYLPISVVIVNHNAGLLLITCIQAALRQAAAQIIVVDNASSDASLAALSRHFPAESRLTVIRNTHNTGFAAGCNQGLYVATAPYVLFLNPDCILAENTLKRLLRVLESDPCIGMTGGRLISPDGTEQGGGRRAIPTPWRSFVRAFGLYRLGKYWPHLFSDFHLHQQSLPRTPIEVEAISGALMLTRQTAIQEIGVWDEHYFLHCEDLDWCMRFKQKNWKICFVPDASALHYQGTCSRTRPFFVAWHKHKGMLRFYQKFFRHQYPGLLMWLVAWGIWLRFGVLVLLYGVRHLYQQFKTKHA